MGHLLSPLAPLGCSSPSPPLPHFFPFTFFWNRMVVCCIHWKHLRSISLQVLCVFVALRVSTACISYHSKGECIASCVKYHWNLASSLANISTLSVQPFSIHLIQVPNIHSIACFTIHFHCILTPPLQQRIHFHTHLGASLSPQQNSIVDACTQDSHQLFVGLLARFTLPFCLAWMENNCFIFFDVLCFHHCSGSPLSGCVQWLRRILQFT